MSSSKMELKNIFCILCRKIPKSIFAYTGVYTSMCRQKLFKLIFLLVSVEHMVHKEHVYGILHKSAVDLQAEYTIIKTKYI